MSRRHVLSCLSVLALALGAVMLMAGVASAAAPKLSVSDASNSESGGVIKFQVHLSKPSARRVTVDWNSAYGTNPNAELNAEPITEYESKAGTLVFKPGQTKKSAKVSVYGDLYDDWDREFLVELANPKRATIADWIATGTIYDDDAQPVVTITPASQSVGEPTTVGGETSVGWTMTLDPQSNRTVMVGLAFSGTATDGGVEGDYSSSGASGEWVFLPGQITKNPSITVYGDSRYTEGDETAIAGLTGPDGATIGFPGAGTLTITDFVT